MDLRDGVEVQVVRLREAREHGRRLPAHPGEPLGQDPLLRRDVPAVVGQPLGAEHQQRAGPLRITVVAEAHTAAGLAVEAAGAVQAQVVGNGEAGHVVAQEAQMPGLLAEDQTTGVRVQAVGADDQVEAAGRAPLERDFDALRGVGQRRDGVAEHVLHRVLRAFVHELGQVAAEDLHVAAHHLRGQLHARGAVGGDDALRAHVRPTGVDLVPDAHRGEHPAVHVAPEVDGEAAGAQGGRLLDDRDPGAPAGQVQGEGGPGDAGAGDQDGQVAEVVCLRHAGHCPGPRLPRAYRSLTAADRRPRPRS